MKLFLLFPYRGDTATPKCLNYGTLLGRLGRLGRASACVIAMASITTSAFAAGPKVYVYDYACAIHPYMTGRVVVRAP